MVALMRAYKLTNGSGSVPMTNSTLDNIYAKKRSSESLEHFAMAVFGYLHFGDVEEHYSANYWGEQYFVAHDGSISLTVAASDDALFDDYEYWIAVYGPEIPDGEDLVAIGDELARRLTIGGFEIARPCSLEDWLYKKPVSKRLIYQRKLPAEAPNEPRVEITIEELRNTD